MFPVLRYFCLLIPWSFTESEKTSIIPFSVKNAKEEKQIYGYQSINQWTPSYNSMEYEQDPIEL